MNPVPVHAESPQDHPLIVLAQIVVEKEQSLGFQLEEHRIDELYYVVASHLGKKRPQLKHQTYSSQFPRFACHIDIAWIVFPEIAIGHDTHLVA